MDENIDNLIDILFHLEIEGTYFYQDEENKDDYFIAYRLIVIASNQDNEDCEGEIGFYLKSEMSDDNLIFTYVEPDSEPQRIVGVPEIQHLEFENSLGWLLEDTNIVDAVEFLKNMKTINFEDLKSANSYDKNNYKSSIFEKDYNLSKIENDEKKIKNNKREITELLFEASIYKLSNPELALNKIDNVIALEVIDKTENAFSYLIRAEIFIKLNNIENAKKDLEMALKFEPDNEKTKRLLITLK
jgi:hypothetical protein